MYGYIYKIENLVNGKVYIGQTVQKPEMRRYRHFYQLINTKHKNSHLQNSFNKYGEDHFKFTVLNWSNSLEDLNKAEIYYINKYGALNRDKGYNAKEGGSNGKHSLETKQKIRENHIGMRGKTHSIESRRKISIAGQGKRLTAEHRRKLSENHVGMIGKKHSLETRIKLSENHSKYWLGKSKEEQPFHGKNHTIGSRRKISIGHSGNGIFGFTGAYFDKRKNPETKCWQSIIRANGKRKSLGVFHDPVSANIVYKLVQNEIF